MADKSNGILTAIVQSMREEEKNVEVKHAAAKALENALEFAKENFKRPVRLKLLHLLNTWLTVLLG